MTQHLSHHGIGASEISAVAGMNPYASPWDVWRHKTGETPDKPMTPPMEWGHRLEPAIRQKYSDETKSVVRVPVASMFHPDTTWARATPDGIVLGPQSTEHIVQCKNVGTWVEKSWRDAPPAYVQLQEQWEMYVTGLVRADIAVLIGGSDFRIYTVHRDDKLIGDLVTIAADFWRLVQNKEEPRIDESKACREHFERRLRKQNAIELDADSDLEDTIAHWQFLHHEAKKVENSIDRLKNQVRAAMADAGAHRIRSKFGSPYLQERAGAVQTNWRLIAELLGSTKCTADEFKALVAANTEQKPASIILSAPKNWAKESNQ